MARDIPAGASYGDECPVKGTIGLISGKWTAYVLFELAKEQPLRFKELQRRVEGVTATVLTSTLRDLEEKGLVAREQFMEVPPHVEYSLTEAGAGLAPVFEAMADWGRGYFGG